MLTYRERLSWAAGLVDGEGCFTTGGIRRKTGLVRIKFTMAQKDIEVLDDFMGIVHVGVIYKHKASSLSSDGFLNRYEAQGHANVQHIAASLWFGLGSVKREQAHRVLCYWQKNRGLRC